MTFKPSLPKTRKRWHAVLRAKRGFLRAHQRARMLLPQSGWQKDSARRRLSSPLPSIPAFVISARTCTEKCRGSHGLRTSSVECGDWLLCVRCDTDRRQRCRVQEQEEVG